jgi:hypothetical protein
LAPKCQEPSPSRIQKGPSGYLFLRVEILKVVSPYDKSRQDEYSSVINFMKFKLLLTLKCHKHCPPRIWEHPSGFLRGDIKSGWSNDKRTKDASSLIINFMKQTLFLTQKFQEPCPPKIQEHPPGILVLIFHQLVHSTFACSLELFTHSVVIILLQLFPKLYLFLHLTGILLLVFQSPKISPR